MEMAARVFIVHGATSMPSVRNEPLAIVAPMSRLSCTTSASALTSLRRIAQFGGSVQEAGTRHNEVGFDRGVLVQLFQQTHPIDGAGRAGDGQDDSSLTQGILP